MIDLSLDRPGDHLYVRSVGARGIRIGERTYSGPLLVTADSIDSAWPPLTMADLLIEHLEALFALTPEVALLGTGARHLMLPRTLLVEAYRRGFNLEVMDTAAACRTFNVLVSDGRKVVAGLLPPGAG